MSELDETADPERPASVLAALAGALWGLGQADRSRATQRRRSSCCPRAATPGPCPAAGPAVRFLVAAGALPRGAKRRPRRSRPPTGRASRCEAGVLNRLGFALFALGETTRRRERLREAMEVAQRSGTTDDLATAYINYADALHGAGHSNEARETARRGLAEVAKGARRLEPLAALDPPATSPRSSSTSATGTWRRTRCRTRRERASGRRAGVTRGSDAQLALGRGEDAAARAALERADELLADALEPQYIAVLAALARPSSSGALATSTAARAAVVDRGSTGSSSAARTAARHRPGRGRGARRSRPTPPSAPATSATTRRRLPRSAAPRRWPSWCARLPRMAADQSRSALRRQRRGRAGEGGRRGRSGAAGRLRPPPGRRLERPYPQARRALAPGPG